MKQRRANGLMASLGLVLAACAPAVAAPALSSRDAIVIAEAYHLWQSLGEDVWPGWIHVPMPMVYVTTEHEFAIGFDVALDGFTLTAYRVDNRNIQVRAREREARVAAAMDFQDVPALVLGAPEILEWSPTKWTLKAAHEMFHVLSMQRGSATKIRALEIGPADDASWQLEYPFPYDDLDVMRLMHLQGYPIFLAISAPAGDENIVYNAGTALEALEVLKAVLRARTGDDRAARYAMFQETEEGAGRYTEHRMAQLAATGYEPLTAFRELDDFAPYATVWEQESPGRATAEKATIIPFWAPLVTATWSGVASMPILASHFAPADR